MMITPLYLLKYAGIRCAMATGKEQGAVTPASSGDQNKGGLRGKLNKVVLAYSGGLDTSVIVPWLRYKYSLFYYAFCLILSILKYKY